MNYKIEVKLLQKQIPRIVKLAAHTTCMSTKKWLQFVNYSLKIPFYWVKKDRNLNHTIIEGKTPKEGRGVDRKSGKFAEKKQKLREFLNKLPAHESHYNRLKSKRIYLSSELNAARLLKLYNRSVPINLRMSRTMFHNIFTTEYNIGFKSPATVACSACILWAHKIKSE